ncbi:type IV pilus modification PilV family protein [Allochromatium palmeri]|uniref:Prepilin-type N-terminal cleavage/methylation domain-containing protein n=1 Tax=Allochromatium palmeri TaxID=231048 RepID=A0A6N8EIP8_9GAMM|nr:prepilin-type N-terminal cleavage/methylation domain-containing protein [Allochromatium palmeri]MTW22377.1 prepilin-type N-terminal cleavage/methylation domain-containing protein [Allochromatium palmeri]
MSPRRPSQQGFSLLEVLVAFAILAVSLGVLLGIFSRATSATIASAQYSQAATLAESLLTLAGQEIALDEGAVSGETDSGFAWELTLVEIDLSAEFPMSEPQARAYRVNANVLWFDAGRARHLTLSTLKLAPLLAGAGR